MNKIIYLSFWVIYLFNIPLGSVNLEDLPVINLSDYSELGEGSFANVYQSGNIALKLLKDQRNNQSLIQEFEILDLLKETKAVVPVYELVRVVDNNGTRVGMLMEKGKETLSDAIDQGKEFSQDKLLSSCQHMKEAISLAKSQENTNLKLRRIFTDVKPENMIVLNDGSIVFIDLGVGISPFYKFLSDGERASMSLIEAYIRSRPFKKLAFREMYDNYAIESGLKPEHNYFSGFAREIGLPTEPLSFQIPDEFSEEKIGNYLQKAYIYFNSNWSLLLKDIDIEQNLKNALKSLPIRSSSEKSKYINNAIMSLNHNSMKDFLEKIQDQAILFEKYKAVYILLAGGDRNGTKEVKQFYNFWLNILKQYEPELAQCLTQLGGL